MIEFSYEVSDTHGNFDFLDNFCEKAVTTRHDLLIILGDAGINYYPPNHKRYMNLINKLCCAPITIFCIHGNHEDRPEDRPEYHLEDVGIGDEVWVSHHAENVWFAKMVGEYVLNESLCLVAGGAYSVDKWWRMSNGNKWVANEQLSYLEQRFIESLVDNKHYDHIFTHTCPSNWQPIDLFLADVDQEKVDDSMEVFFQRLVDYGRFSFNHWWFGHYHDHRMDVCGNRKVHMLYETIVELPSA